MERHCVTQSLETFLARQPGDEARLMPLRAFLSDNLSNFADRVNFVGHITVNAVVLNERAGC